MSVIYTENFKLNVMKIFVAEGVSWYILVELLEKLTLQIDIKSSASRNLHWTTRSQFSPFQALTFRLLSNIHVNIILTLKRFLQKLICSL